LYAKVIKIHHLTLSVCLHYLVKLENQLLPKSMSHCKWNLGIHLARNEAEFNDLENNAAVLRAAENNAVVYLQWYSMADRTL